MPTYDKRGTGGLMDITKCHNLACPAMWKCYRVMAPSNPYWQSVGFFEWREEGGVFKCDGYYAMDNDGYGYEPKNDSLTD